MVASSPDLAIIAASPQKGMLTLLKIRNLALVDHLEWDLGGGLVGVTGETGAGKSVIVGALKLVLGERADKGIIRTGEDQCTVEAIFDLPDVSMINEILDDSGLDLCEGNELIIRRVVGSKSNKQFVNNGVATLGVLKRLGQHLVDLHGPHDHQSLLSPERQMAMLDAYAGATPEMQAYRDQWAKWREAQDEYETARAQREVSDQEKELLKFQVEEIDAAELKPGEEADLEERFRRTSNSSRLGELAGKAGELLSETVTPGLEELQRITHELSKIDPAISELSEEVEGAASQMQELERSISDYLSELNLDPEEVRQVEERFNLVETLKRKYGPTLDDAIEHAEEARQRLEGSENREAWLSGLKDGVEAALKKLRAAARKLSTKRKKSAPALAKEIRTHLIDLGFKQGEFEVALSPREEPGSLGLENVEYLFGPNPGEPLKPLRQVASSGEISRVMLAVKNALADQDSTPLMVFDEIDANVGGEIARAVGIKMASLGERHQVVSITHFPQVAAVAHQHFVVEKRVEGGRSLSSLTEVSGEGRIDELVRMLGGGGDSAREMAKSLLQ
ncbi:DNA repair protein RecN [Akkermansiaceae bacterium]|nr:DNA repair protein RecN [Akkermansiaceae bacterium]MDB4725479.1 DNA repair protein RecN [Akkermansiaceae bacterium]MDB4820613.1 DNA repair protein RecN [Akkermansiaceae bacterium]